MAKAKATATSWLRTTDVSRRSWALPAKIRRNIGFKLAGTVVEKGLRAVIVFAAARILGPQAWGKYTYAFTLAMLLAQVTDLGLGLFINRETARNGKPDPALIGQVLTLKAALACVYLLGIAAVTLWHMLHGDGDHTVTLAIVICGGIALAVTAIDSFVHVFRGIQNLALEARTHAAHAIFAVVVATLALGGAVLTFGLKMSDEQRDTVVIVYASRLLISSLMAVGYSYGILRRLTEINWGLSRQTLRRFRSEVLPLGIAIVASMIYYRIDVPMIHGLLPAATADWQTGLYTAAYKLLEYTALFPAILLAATFPALSEKVNADPVLAAHLHKVTLRWLVLGGGVVCAIFALLAEPLVTLLYGAEFTGSAPVLVALAPCVLLTFVNYLETHMLVALGLVKAQMVISLTLIGVNIGLNWLWIPRWQGTGAAWATAATEVCLLLAVAPLVARSLRAREQSATQPAPAEQP